MRPSISYLKTRISVDVVSGVVTWIDATKNHRPLNGKEAGCSRRSGTSGKLYWHIKVDGVAINRSHIVFLFAHGRWSDIQIDHINGNSLDDRSENLREVTGIENSWNHKGRRKSSWLPMGVRKLPSGMYQSRITCNKKVHHLGAFSSLEKAVSVYQQKRKEMFGDYA